MAATNVCSLAIADEAESKKAKLVLGGQAAAVFTNGSWKIWSAWEWCCYELDLYGTGRETGRDMQRATAGNGPRSVHTIGRAQSTERTHEAAGGQSRFMNWN